MSYRIFRLSEISSNKVGFIGVRDFSKSLVRVKGRMVKSVVIPKGYQSGGVDVFEYHFKSDSYLKIPL